MMTQPLPTSLIVSDLLGFIEGRLESLDCTPRPVPAEFAQRAGEGRLATTVIRGQAWSSPLLDVRCSSILGSTVEILNLLAFPRRPWAEPIFASQLVLFGGRPWVVVADVEPAWGDDAERTTRLLAGLRPCAASVSDLPGAGEIPEWARGIFTPYAFFSRPDDPKLIGRVAEGYRTYWNAYEQLWIRPAAESVDDGDSAAIRESCHMRLAEYKEHHIQHSPGLAYLGRVFGEEWTRSFLAKFMYA